jgi:hypothetical protein
VHAHFVFEKGSAYFGVKDMRTKQVYCLAFIEVFTENYFVAFEVFAKNLIEVL